MVSSDLGKLEASRQRMAACACTAGATPAASTPAMPAFLINARRSMEDSSGGMLKGDSSLTALSPPLSACPHEGTQGFSLAENHWLTGAARRLRVAASADDL